MHPKIQVGFRYAPLGHSRAIITPARGAESATPAVGLPAGRTATASDPTGWVPSGPGTATAAEASWARARLAIMVIPVRRMIWIPTTVILRALRRAQQTVAISRKLIRGDNEDAAGFRVDRFALDPARSTEGRIDHQIFRPALSNNRRVMVLRPMDH
jgi:hypothetical protein